MSGQATLQQRLGRLIEVEAASRPPPSAAEIAEAERLKAEIDALCSLAASIIERDQ